MKIHAQQTYHVALARYFELLTDGAARARREIEGAGSVSYRVLSSSVEGGVRRYRAEMVSRVEAPAAVRKIIGETSRMEEEITYREGGDVAQVRYRTDSLGDRARLEGEIRARAVCPGQTEATLDITAEVKMFGLGGVIEKMIDKELREHLAKDAAFVNTHLAST
jgi:hypothetical protein